MPTLTVDLYTDPVTYVATLADGSQRQGHARSASSLAGTLGLYRHKGYDIVIREGVISMASSKREKKQRQADALFKIQVNGTLKGAGSAQQLYGLKKDGLITYRPDGSIGITAAGAGLLAEYDPPNAGLVRNQTAESSDVAVSEEDLDKFFADLAAEPLEQDQTEPQPEQVAEQPEPDETFDWEKDQADWRAYLAEQEACEQPPTPVYYSAPVRDALRVIRDNTQAALINLAVHRPTESIYQIESILTDVNKLLDVY